MYNIWRGIIKIHPTQAKQHRDRFAAMQKEKQLTSEAEIQANFALGSANRSDYSRAILQFRHAIAECGTCRSRPDMYKDLGLIECKSGDLSNGRKDLIIALWIRTTLISLGRLRSHAVPRRATILHVDARWGPNMHDAGITRIHSYVIFPLASTFQLCSTTVPRTPNATSFKFTVGQI